jgi:hypothetical protein
MRRWEHDHLSVAFKKKCFFFFFFVSAGRMNPGPGDIYIYIHTHTHTYTHTYMDPHKTHMPMHVQLYSHQPTCTLGLQRQGSHPSQGNLFYFHLKAHPKSTTLLTSTYCL